MPIKKLDRGHQESDDQLKELEKQLEKEYKNAYNEMRAKTNGYLRQFKEQEAAKLKLVKAGELSESEYLDWRRRQMLLGHQFDELVKDLSYDMTHTNEIATAMINGNSYQAFADNHNYGAYEVCKGTGEALRFDIYNKEAVERLVKDNPKLLPKSRVDIAKDMRWNERHIRSALTQGILQGDSIPNIAQRLKQVTTMSDSAAVRNARTMTTAAESAGRMEAYKEAEEMGIEMEKVWIATLDDRTRDAHVELDGQAVPLDAYFVNSIGKIFEPADPNADPENVYNCRCTMISQVKGRPKDLSGRAMSDSLGDMTYDEWKAAAAERQAEENNVPLDEIEQDPAPRESQENTADYIADVVPESEIPDSWESRAEKASEMDWHEMHEMMVDNPDSYIYSDEYKEANAEYQENSKIAREAQDEMRDLREELKGESMPKPKDEWTLEDDIAALVGEKPVKYTERGEEIHARMDDLYKTSREAEKKASSANEILDEMDKRAREKELSEWNAQEHPFIKGDINKDYDGFSTTMRIAQYDEDLKAGKGFIAEMSPDEYLDRISFDVFNQSKERTTQCFYDNVKEYAKEMASGTKFDMGYINYAGGRGGEKGQEGRHRAMAAKCLGIEKIPVYIIPSAV